MRCIAHAERIIFWQENVSEEEMPPAWAWPYDEALEDWFEDVKYNRKQKYSSDSDDEEVPLTKNEFARGRR